MFEKLRFAEARMSSLYRPDAIVIKKDAAVKRIAFSWPDGVCGGSLHLSTVDG